MKIDSKGIDEFHDDLQKAMEPLKKKYDVTIELGSTTYAVNQFTFKLTVTNNEKMEAVSREEFLAELPYFLAFGFQPDDYKREFDTKGGEKAILLGFRHRAKKYPLKVEIDGQEMNCTLGYLIMPHGRTILVDTQMNFGR